VLLIRSNVHNVTIQAIIIATIMYSEPAAPTEHSVSGER
jgi:hypothetical protein